MVHYLDILMTNHPCMPGINPAWSWYIIFIMLSDLVGFASGFFCLFFVLFCRIFSSVFIRDTDL